MPRISDRVSINDPKLDNRFKFYDYDKNMVKRMWDNGDGLSMRAIARQGILQPEGWIKQISRSMIKCILFPERAEAILARAKEVKRWTKYNKKEYHTPAMRKHREHKKELFQKGLIHAN